MKKAFSLILCVLLCLPGIFLCRAGDAAQTGADAILHYYQQSAGVTDTQALVDNVWSDSAGRGAESYVLAAKQYKNELNLSRYAASLKKYLAANTVGSATTREMIALMFVLSGVPDAYITQTLNEAPGKLGIMSWVFALHLLNNGYTSTITTQKKAQKQLLDLQLADGGWAVSGSVSDVDVTAMTVTALAPAYKQDSAVTAAVDSAIRLLSERQNADGSLSSYGVKNPESIAQTVIALSALGLDAAQDSRFSKNGHTLFDALASFRLADGSFCHEAGGASNRLATVQVFSAYVAAYRQAHGLGSLYYVPPAQRPTVTQPATTKSGGGAMPIQTTPPTTATPKPVSTTAAPKTEATTVPTPIAPAAATVPTQQGQTQAPGKTTAAVASTAAAKPTQEAGEASTAFTEESTAESTEAQVPLEPASSTGSEPTTAEPPQPQEKKANIKLVLLIAVWALAAAACVVLFLLGKRNKSWFIAVLLAAALFTAGLLVTSIQRKEEFFSVPETVSDAETIAVSIAIRCDSVLPYAAENPAVPTDGVILNASEIALAPDSTAYDQLLLAAKLNGFTFINKSAADNDYKDAYISTLAGLSEFDYGENSGWLFAVNGKLASVGCGAYKLKDGDSVVWYYTCNYVEDMTRDFLEIG
ncbi:MAG: DUF4430 domain-containing protein [Clostridia bacterium]|nr:DUF4430 domain-containing protein [Clostridia bacterium]